MDETTDTETTLAARAEGLLEGRRAAIGGLETASRALEAAQRQLAATQQDVAAAVSAAKTAGWTTGELRALGIKMPGERRKTSPPRRRRGTAPPQRV